MRRFIVAWAISAIALVWPVCASADVQDNDLVAHKIHDVLKSSGRMSGSSFVIKCQDGTAWLEGRVSSEEQKALALKLTGEVPEVADVVDHLRVEPKKSRNPVARVLTHLTEEPQPQAEAVADESSAAEETAEAPAEADEAPIRQTKPVISWFSRPSVKAAEAPRPRVREVANKANHAVNSHQDETSDSDAPVYPEALETAEDSSNPLVKQVANLRTIFRRNTKPALRQAASTEAEPRVMPQPSSHSSSRCATCNPATRSAAQRTVQTVSNKTRATARQATLRSEPTQAGRVRMVPMMEMPDGTLVPVQEARRAPLGQPIPVQPVASPNRSKAGSSKPKGRTNVARRQEMIEGPMDVEPAAGPVPVNGAPLPAYVPGVAAGVAPAYYDQPHMPNYAWPSYASHPNYAGVTYPRQYSPTAWPYIGPFYPYPQVPLGWRKVTLEWDDGWWFLDFDDTNRSYAY
jgi:hypothetical protein